MVGNLFKNSFKFLKPLFIMFDNYKMGFAQLLIFLFIVLIIYKVLDHLDVLPFDGKIIEGAKGNKKKKKNKRKNKETPSTETDLRNQRRIQQQNRRMLRLQNQRRRQQRRNYKTEEEEEL